MPPGRRGRGRPGWRWGCRGSCPAVLVAIFIDVLIVVTLVSLRGHCPRRSGRQSSGQWH